MVDKNKKIKWILFLATFFIIVITLSVELHAAEKGEVVRVGFVKDYGMIQEEDGTTSGYLVDYLNEISKHTGWNYEYVSCGWEDGLALLKGGKIDLFGPLQKTAEREESIGFHDRQLGMEYGILYMNRDRADIYYNNPKSFDGKRVATVPNNYFNDKLKQYCSENGIEMEMVITTIDKFQTGLASGKFDLVMGGSTLALADTSVAGKIAAEPFYYGVTKANESVRQGLNNAIEKISIEDAYFEAKLFEKYFGTKAVAKPTFTYEETQYLESKPSLTIVCNPNWIPLSYYDEESGELLGIAVEIVMKMCEDAGITITVRSAQNYEEAIAMIAAGEAEMMLGFEQNDYATMQYTQSFLHVPMVMVGKGTVDFREDLKVAIHAPSLQIENEVKENYPNYKYNNYPSVRELLRAMETGQEGYAIFNYYAFDELKWCVPNKTFHMSVTDVSFDVSIGVPKTANKNIISILDKAIKGISPEQISAIAFDNTARRGNDLLLRRMVQENLPYILVIVVFIGLVFILIVANGTKKKKEALQNLAFFDELTGVYSTDKFKNEAVTQLRHGAYTSYVLAGIDINKFRYINDVYGYKVGDSVLIQMAKHIKKYTAAPILIGRMGGDNFMIMIEKKLFPFFLEHLEKVDQVIHENVAEIPMGYRVSYSLGYYAVLDNKEEFSTLLDKVNVARKNNKEDSQNNIMEYTEEMDKEIQWQKEVTLVMEQALENREFVTYFQPKYDAKNEQIAGAEALVRWINPTHGFLAPMKFIPLFEKNGFIKKLDFYMFEEVCRFLAGNQNKNKEIKISVNLSRHHLQNESLAQELSIILNKYGVKPELIEIELTESILMEYSEKVLCILKEIRKVGMSISIDDFGSGYSSLSILGDLPVDVLKIDKGFVDRMNSTKNGKNIVHKIIELAKQLSLTTVAEGVETKEQHILLREMGCDLIQGYYFSKPIPCMDFEKMF